MTGSTSFNYGEYYRRIREIESLTIKHSAIPWLEAQPADPNKVEKLLYLGCNALATPHLAQDCIAVMSSLDCSFATVGGPAYCCGVVHFGNNDLRVASQISRNTVSRFDAFAADELVIWCPTCEAHLADVVSKEIAIGMKKTHITAFLDQRKTALNYAGPVERRVAIHVHEGTERQDDDAGHAISLLESVPGIQIVAVLSSPQLGYACGNKVISEMGAVAFGKSQANLVQSAIAAGADTLATVYHSCQREWSAISADVTVMNYVSIVAEALGSPHRDTYQELRKLADAESIVEYSKDNWVANGLTREEAERIARKYFCSTERQDAFAAAAAGRTDSHM